MSSNITPVDTFSTIITVPDAGDAATAASVTLAPQALANRSENNNVRIDGIISDVAALSTTTDFLVPIVSSGAVEGSEWNLDFSSTFGAWSSNSTSNDVLVIEITSFLPVVGETIDSITAYVRGDAGHGALPGTLPSIALLRYGKTDGVQVQVGANEFDGSANVTAFQSNHTIDFTGIAHTILADQRYVVFVFGEGGANAQVDFALLSMELGWTVTP